MNIVGSVPRCHVYCVECLPVTIRHGEIRCAASAFLSPSVTNLRLNSLPPSSQKPPSPLVPGQRLPGNPLIRVESCYTKLGHRPCVDCAKYIRLGHRLVVPMLLELLTLPFNLTMDRKGLVSSSASGPTGNVPGLTRYTLPKLYVLPQVPSRKPPWRLAGIIGRDSWTGQNR